MKNLGNRYFFRCFVLITLMVVCQNYSFPRKLKKSNIYDSQKQFGLGFSSLNEADGQKRTLEKSSEDEVTEESCFKEKAMILYYNFEKQKGSHSRVPDRSGCDNHGIMDVGTMIFMESNSSCGSAAYLWTHDIKIIASSFQNPPKTGLSISMWAKLIWSNGTPKELFSVNGPHFGVLFLRVDMDTVIWSYRRPNNTIVFSTIGYNAFPSMNLRKEASYAHIAATYNALTGVAQIFINGRILNRTVTSNMVPFSYWGNNINIGGNFRKMPFRGTVDEIKLFNYALSPSSVEVLANACHFGPSKDNFEIFKRSKLMDKPEIEADEEADTLGKDSLMNEPSFDETIYKDMPDYERNFDGDSEGDSKARSLATAKESDVYEAPSDQAFAPLDLGEDVDSSELNDQAEAAY